MSKKHNQEIVNYYHKTTLQYNLIWQTFLNKAMHFGYWDSTTFTPGQALNRMNYKLAKLAEINQVDVVLDAGCGYGSSSLWLAKNIGCQVVGITLVPEQKDSCVNSSKKLGLDNKVSFLVEDFTHTSFNNNSFSVVWGLESIVHCENKANFIREAARILKPGGKVIISEYILDDSLQMTKLSHELLSPWLKGWVMPNLISAENYTALLKEAGFSEIKILDWTKNVFPSLLYLGVGSYLAFPLTFLLFKLQLIRKEWYENLLACIFQNICLIKGIWRYKVILAQKQVR